MVAGAVTADRSGPPTCVVIGRGRAGSSLALALRRQGCDVSSLSGRALVHRGVDEAATDVLESSTHVLVAVSDAAIPDVAARLAPLDLSTAVVAHVSGACGLDVLEPLGARASLHPLMSLPDAETGAARLLDQCDFAVDGDDRIEAIVGVLGGRSFRVAPDHRVLYHAAACVAANHLTALCAQVEALAAAAHVPVDAYWRLMSTTLSNVADAGAARSLTGPAARGDWGTVGRHLAALPVEERALYRCLAVNAAALAGQTWPDEL